ncbi:DUF6455 family protein [Cognatishimia sp. 1_MG-2023]|uniref:DUF6455 family protein n=1 Tax=Cognatishimia sp. 1_MG-2023 TaxID=3062642 RepID=UPI0026E370AE|nr:DUF6455 family protein [Cognatishimia sp. 1_MG-2023]MDO6726056.1 DUF6455 family protein [Cognatishimia sp. 1_MG-2023]
MPDRETLQKHVYLFDTMSEKLGHDMQQHTLDGDVSIDALTNAVVRCSQCGHADDCAAKLNAARNLSQPPAYCQNKALFKTL